MEGAVINYLKENMNLQSFFKLYQNNFRISSDYWDEKYGWYLTWQVLKSSSRVWDTREESLMKQKTDTNISTVSSGLASGRLSWLLEFPPFCMFSRHKVLQYRVMTNFHKKFPRFILFLKYDSHIRCRWLFKLHGNTICMKRNYKIFPENRC